jgi:hypothetical protein
MKTLLILVLLLGVVAVDSLAAEKADVLNFEGDVIEGQKKVPELFLQTDVQRLSLESVLYQRKNFNDFHAVDSKQRPRLSDPPKREQRRR